jgi:hypothetical protein
MAAAEEELPQLDFSTFVLGIIGSAYVHLGDAPPDLDGAEALIASAEPDLELARQNIDLLLLLQRKTKGNLTGDEERLLDQALIDLKARYAEVTKAG